MLSCTHEFMNVPQTCTRNALKHTHTQNIISVELATVVDLKLLNVIDCLGNVENSLQGNEMRQIFLFAGPSFVCAKIGKIGS